MPPVSRIRRFDHGGITVADLDTVSAFFVELGLEVEGRTFVGGEFLDTVIGIPDARTEIVLLRAPDGGAGLELASFIRPDHEPGSPAAMATELGLRSVAFEVDELQTIVERLANDGYGVVGGIGEYEHVWRMASGAGRRGSSSLSLSGSTDSASRSGWQLPSHCGAHGGDLVVQRQLHRPHPGQERHQRRISVLQPLRRCTRTCSYVAGGAVPTGAALLER
jgi:catechol 2,3-dioxygenase-like lactoylglutathione lyase family enzyme